MSELQGLFESLGRIQAHLDLQDELLARLLETARGTETKAETIAENLEALDKELTA